MQWLGTSKQTILLISLKFSKSMKLNKCTYEKNYEKNY
jgi:hypothetical protein